MPFKDIQALYKEYKRRWPDGGSYSWEALDLAIVGMCEKMPGHSCADEVYAKIRVINRAYLANLHLRAKDAEWLVAERFANGGANTIVAQLGRFSRAYALQLTQAPGDSEAPQG
jgi:hypothetical protein